MKRLTCQEVMDQLADYLEPEAQAELVEQVNLHVGSCLHCRVEVDTLRRTIMIYHFETQVVLPVQLDARLRMALEQAYRERGYPGESGEGEA